MKLLEEEEYEENALVEFCRNDADKEDIMIDDDDASKKRYGASLGGTLCFINNPTLRLLSYSSTYDE
jgi:hypothetical protein